MKMCGNGHNALQKFSAAMDLPPPVTPKSFKKHEVPMPLYSTLLFFPVVFLSNYLHVLS